MIWLGYGSREKCAELHRMCGTMLDLWDCVGLRTTHEYVSVMQCRLRHCECVFVVQYEMKRHMCDKEMFVQNHYGSLTVACAKVRTRHSQ